MLPTQRAGLRALRINSFKSLHLLCCVPNILPIISKVLVYAPTTAALSVQRGHFHGHFHHKINNQTQREIKESGGVCFLYGVLDSLVPFLFARHKKGERKRTVWFELNKEESWNLNKKKDGILLLLLLLLHTLRTIHM